MASFREKNLEIEPYMINLRFKDEEIDSEIISPLYISDLSDMQAEFLCSVWLSFEERR